MGKWRDAFEAGAADERDYLRNEGRATVDYVFGTPATPEEIAQLERQLGIKLPEDVRELLTEFNGVWEQRPGYPPDRLYLTIKDILVDVPEYMRDSGNYMPPEDQVRKVIFVAQSNGFGALMGVCLERFGDFQKGEVVMLDHETGEFTADHPSLMDFVRHGCKLN